ncbi:MAG: hypothetical protein IVW57_03585 [Ktedonobacterales bacterium]|nr:hypothetical protein [Ktedonobacterales bacterium]
MVGKAFVTRKNGLVALAGVGLVLVGLVGGMLISGRLTARAASDTRPQAVKVTGEGLVKYCQIYEGALANDLNVSSSTLERDNLDALGKALDQMVKDGQITSFEETQVKQLLQQVGTQPCANLNAKTLATFLQGDTAVLQQALVARMALVSAVARALGETPAVLQAELGQGKTLAQLAGAHHVALATVSAAYLTAAKAFLAQAVSQGLITPAQATYASTLLSVAVAQGTYPLLSSEK